MARIQKKTGINLSRVVLRGKNLPPSLQGRLQSRNGSFPQWLDAGWSAFVDQHQGSWGLQ
jgi:hypothetical protein